MAGFTYTALELVPTPGAGTPGAGAAIPEETAALPEDPEADEVASRWMREAGAHFERAVTNGTIQAPLTRTFKVLQYWSPEDPVPEVNVRLGIGLFEDLIHVYGLYGWAGLDAAIHNITDPNAGGDPVEAFVAKTHRAVTQLVILGLDRIERAGIDFAHTQWTKALKKLNGYTELTGPPPYPRVEQRRFDKAGLGAKAWKACTEFAQRRRSYKAIVEKMDTWPYSQGKDNSSPFRPLWEEMESRRAAVLGELTASIRSVATVSPALLLALEQLHDDFGENPDDAGYDTGFLAWHVHYQAMELREDTKELLEGLNVGPLAKKRLSSAVTTYGQIRLRDHGGLEEVLMAILSGSKQQVLLNATLLADLANPGSADSPVKQGTWEWFVLGVHLRDMRALAERKAASDAEFAVLWGWLTKAVALLSLLTLAVATFGAGSPIIAGSAAAGLVATLGAGVTVLALSMTALEAAYALTVERGALSKEISERLHRLAVSDPEAVAAIGELLTARQSISTGLLQEVALMALSMGAAKIKRVAQALDVHGAVEDMQVLFAPLPSSKPAGSLE